MTRSMFAWAEISSEMLAARFWIGSKMPTA